MKTKRAWRNLTRATARISAKNFRRSRSFPPRAIIAAALASLALSGCDRNSGNNGAQTDASGSAAQSTTVTLTKGQLGAIKLGAAQVYAFPVEAHAVGSVSFTDDPALMQAESTLLGAAATYNLTRKELARVKSLGTGSGIAAKEFEQAVSDEQTAEANYKAARDALRALGKSDAEIDRMVATGKIESPSSSYRAIKWVNASASEGDSSLVHAGQAVTVSVPALSGRKFQGTVSEAYASLDPNSHRMTLRAQVPDPNDELRPGMLADVAIEVQAPVESVAIPENGVVREGDGTMTAWVTRDRIHFAQRVVAAGLRENGRVQILKGVRQGEVVVTDGAVFLDNILNAAPSD